MRRKPFDASLLNQNQKITQTRDPFFLLLRTLFVVNNIINMKDVFLLKKDTKKVVFDGS